MNYTQKKKKPLEKIVRYMGVSMTDGTAMKIPDGRNEESSLLFQFNGCLNTKIDTFSHRTVQISTMGTNMECNLLSKKRRADFFLTINLRLLMKIIDYAEPPILKSIILNECPLFLENSISRRLTHLYSMKQFLNWMNLIELLLNTYASKVLLNVFMYCGAETPNIKQIEWNKESEKQLNCIRILTLAQFAKFYNHTGHLEITYLKKNS